MMHHQQVFSQDLMQMTNNIVHQQSDKNKRKALVDISNMTQNPLQKQKKCSTFSKIEDKLEIKSNLKEKRTGAQKEREMIKDIDEENASDPQYCTEIASIIYKRLKEKEKFYKPSDKFMEFQNDINKSMFAILLDWLVEVAMEYKATDRTLFLTKNYIERFLSIKRVARSELQLVGISAMMIAAKFYEIYPPGVDDFVFISDSTYSRQQVISMEAFILNTLRFDIVPPTCDEFLKRFMIAAQIDKHKEMSSFCNYLLNLTVQEYGFAKFLPSQVAISAIIVALHTYELPYWNQTLEHYSGYKIDDHEIISCTKYLYQVCVNAPTNKLEAVYNKFSRDIHNGVSKKKLRSFPPL